MKQLLFKNRIRGVSFHRKGSGIGASRFQENAVRLPEDIVRLSKEELRRGRPQNLTSQQVAHLLLDSQRHELHQLVIECIDHVTHWKQLAQALEKYLSRPSHGVSLELACGMDNVENEDTRFSNEKLNFALEVRSIFLLWKHRLSILELIAEAQPFLKDEAHFKPRRMGRDKQTQPVSR